MRIRPLARIARSLGASRGAPRRAPLEPPLLDLFRHFDPLMTMSAVSNRLDPNLGRGRCFILR